jgi:putative FmdB family regulatory protein
MPTYVYQLVSDSGGGCEHCRAAFETVQRMSEAALTKCPKCNAPIERVLQAPMIGDGGKLKGPSAKQLERAGFTQFKRNGKGTYEKTFGKGPSHLHGD